MRRKSNEPGEVDEELLEDSLEEIEILSTEQLPLDFEDSEGRPERKEQGRGQLGCFAVDRREGRNEPGVNRRVDVAEVPLVSGKRSVGFHVPFSSEEIELLLGESGIDHGERDAVECGIPGG